MSSSGMQGYAAESFDRRFLTEDQEAQRRRRWWQKQVNALVADIEQHSDYVEDEAWFVPEQRRPDHDHTTVVPPTPRRAESAGRFPAEEQIEFPRTDFANPMVDLAWRSAMKGEFESWKARYGTTEGFVEYLNEQAKLAKLRACR